MVKKHQCTNCKKKFDSLEEGFEHFKQAGHELGGIAEVTKHQDARQEARQQEKIMSVVFLIFFTLTNGYWTLFSIPLLFVCLFVWMVIDVWFNP